MTPRTRELWWNIGMAIILVPYLTACGLAALFSRIAEAGEAAERTE